jgi:predicted NBD/HSP70 family sugar kinase
VAGPIVGVDVGGTSTRAVSFDGSLAPVATAVADTPRGAVAIAELVTALVADVARAPSGIAIGVPGRVDPARGMVSSAVNLGITAPAMIGELVHARAGVPVHVENDVNAAALGAFSHLGLAPAQSLAYVNVGTGIAAGFVLAGRLWRGAFGGAGEIGHVPMQAHGPACRCGQVGCAEAVGSGRAVADDPARRDDVIRATAWAVQLCAMTVDVDVVVVGGGMTRPAGTFQPALLAALDRRQQASPMLADVDLADRVVLAPADAPLGSLGAVLAARDGSPVR